MGWGAAIGRRDDRRFCQTKVGEITACGTVPRARWGMEEGTGQGSATQNDGKECGGKGNTKKESIKKNINGGMKAEAFRG